MDSVYKDGSGWSVNIDGALHTFSSRAAARGFLRTSQRPAGIPDAAAPARVALVCYTACGACAVRAWAQREAGARLWAHPEGSYAVLPEEATPAGWRLVSLHETVCLSLHP